MENWRKRVKELVKYGFAGAASTLLNLILFGLLEYGGMQYILANWLSYLAAVLFNYMLNLNYVFQVNDKNFRKKQVRFLSFMAVKLGYLAVDSILFYSLVSILGCGLYISRVGITAVGIVGTYVVSKKKIFCR